MKLALLSDLHLEFAGFTSEAREADVIVLAGDIDRGTRGVHFALEAFPGRPVVYVPGNHEHYGCAIDENFAAMRAVAAGSCVHVLDCEVAVVDGVRFVGATLWTDFALHGESDTWAAMRRAREGMNDYRKIREDAEGRGLMPSTTRMLHWKSRRWLAEELAQSHVGKTVVVTHHAPSARSCAPRDRDDPLAPAYASDLAELLVADVALWLHGHTHHCADYVIAGTRVLSNQRGYPDDPILGFDPGLIVEL